MVTGAPSVQCMLGSYLHSTSTMPSACPLCMFLFMLTTIRSVKHLYNTAVLLLTLIYTDSPSIKSKLEVRS